MLIWDNVEVTMEQLAQQNDANMPGQAQSDFPQQITSAELGYIGRRQLHHH